MYTGFKIEDIITVCYCEIYFDLLKDPETLTDDERRMIKNGFQRCHEKILKELGEI